ncbi:MAG TPA: hypothetical protein VM260_06455, partial [Pirellula sp.]|nr:hypothetical protein [Pirellula sp.]
MKRLFIGSLPIVLLPWIGLFATYCIVEIFFGARSFATDVVKNATTSRDNTDNAVLFMDWLPIQKTRMVPTYDPERLSDEGRKTLAKNNDRKLTGHGLEAQHKVFGVRIAVEKASKIGPWLIADKPWEGSISNGTVIHDGDRYRCWYGISVRLAKVDVVYAAGRAIEVS